MRTAIVILNWNTKDYLERFLPSVIKSAYNADVIVADNASTDGSMVLMSERFPDVRTIVLDKNYGFTGGYNRALEQIKDDGYEFYVLLNSDIEVPENWLSPLVQWMDEHEDCGACAPKLHSWQDKSMFEYAGAAGGYIDALGYPFCRGRVMSMVQKDEGQYDKPANVFWATGACLMIRSCLYHKLGGLDYRFFAHMEEIDLCWRLQLRGYKISVVPQSLVWHLGGGTLPNNSPWKLKLNFRNNLLMLQNNLAFTYGVHFFKKFNDRNKAAKYAVWLAGMVIFFRMILDGMSAAVYLLTGKTEYFKAVVSAHSEYRKLRTKSDKSMTIKYLQKYGDKADIEGMYKGWMIPQAILLKERFFGKIR